MPQRLHLIHGLTTGKFPANIGRRLVIDEGSIFQQSRGSWIRRVIVGGEDQVWLVSFPDRIVEPLPPLAILASKNRDFDNIAQREIQGCQPVSESSWVARQVSLDHAQGLLGNISPFSVSIQG